MIARRLKRLCSDKSASQKLKVFLPALVILGVIYNFKIFSVLVSTNKSDTSYCETFDVVYTWVNGSEPEFIESVRKYDPTFDPARFDDKNELKYSLRSLEKFAPWVRSIYIVTNGQIPHWLDLSNSRISVVSHEQIALHPQYLPTFSSSAIETFLHRIPNLSERFLYMNDDIFLGSSLYPEDLYTSSEGVKMYIAWTVPDCAEDCPWAYIGDGSCDEHCNIDKCQFDGGDCAPDKADLHMRSQSEEREAEVFIEVPKLETRSGVLHKRNRHNSFKDFIKAKNITSTNDLKSAIDSFNKNLRTESKVKREVKSPEFQRMKSSKDVFSQSLITTNKLLNTLYGFKSRNVMGHVGFLLEKHILDQMHQKFQVEIERTVSHRFRDPSDLQFAFLYYNFVMSETRNASCDDIFDEFDTDNSSTWSDREIRTFLTRLYPLPLDSSAVKYFEEVVTNCSEHWRPEASATQPQYSTLVYERYIDSNIPTVSKKLMCQCGILKEGLETNFGQRAKYKFTVNSKRSMHSNFMMLTSNITEVVDSLDKFRRNPKKFNCINDNLEPQYEEQNALIRHILEDFYLSLFPQRSQFELPDHYRNRFTRLSDFEEWRDRKRFALIFGYAASVILIGFLLKFCCFHKAKFMRRYVLSL